MHKNGPAADDIIWLFGYPFNGMSAGKDKKLLAFLMTRRHASDFMWVCVCIVIEVSRGMCVVVLNFSTMYTQPYKLSILVPKILCSQTVCYTIEMNCWEGKSLHPCCMHLHIFMLKASYPCVMLNLMY